MSLRFLGLLAFSAAALNASTLVNMQLLSSPGEPSFYTFSVNGTIFTTLCDDPAHSIGQTLYQATETDLTNLSGTLLDRDGDPNELLDYEDIAILDLQAYADPSMLDNVLYAVWSITQGRDYRDPGADALLAWVATQNPANYNLSGFVIFYTPNAQEQIGFVGGAPEVASSVLTGAGLILLSLILVRRRKRGLLPALVVPKPRD